MPDLASLAYVKSVMGITSTTGDVQLQQLVSAASAYFLTATHRKTILAQSFTETISGDGSYSFFPRNTPIISIDSLSIDGNLQRAYTYPSTYGYLVADNGFQVQMVGSGLNLGYRNIILTYTAGYLTVPLDIQEAVAEIVSWKKAKLPRIDVASQTLGGQETVSFSQKDVPPMVGPIIAAYTQLGGFRSR